MISKKLLTTLLLLLINLGCSQDKYPLTKTGEQHQNTLKTEVYINQPLIGDNISLDLAKQVLFKSKAVQKGLRGIKEMQVKSAYPISKDDKVLLYIINYYPSGYAIISALRSHQPLLAHSDKGEITPSNLSPTLSSIIEGYKISVQNSASFPDSIKRQNAIAWESLQLQQQHLRSYGVSPSSGYIQEQLARLQSEGYEIYDYQYLISGSQSYIPRDIINNLFSEMDGSIRPLDQPDVFLLVKDSTYYADQKDPILKTTWHQIGDYSKYVPNHKPDSPNNWPVGCVAIAVGQIMRYHKFPKTYNWSEMPNNYPTDVTAKFLYDVALGVDMEFGISGSSSNIYKAQHYLSKIGYTSNLIDFDKWKIMNSIKHGNPAYLRGLIPDENSGHAFVADGCYSYNFQKHVKIIRITDIGISDALPFFYDTLYEGQTSEWGSPYLHLNLGFSNNENGYYTPDGLAGFTRLRKALINIQPKK